MSKEYCLYIMSSYSNAVLYLGMTNNLVRRICEHKTKLKQGFSAKYNCDKLVYFEVGKYVEDIIAREKQIKNWKRAWKNELVETMNPNWEDLSESIGVTSELVAQFAAMARDSISGCNLDAEPYLNAHDGTANDRRPEVAGDVRPEIAGQARNDTSKSRNGASKTRNGTSKSCNGAVLVDNAAGQASIPLPPPTESGVLGKTLCHGVSRDSIPLPPPAAGGVLGKTFCHCGLDPQSNLAALAKTKGVGDCASADNGRGISTGTCADNEAYCAWFGGMNA